MGKAELAQVATHRAHKKDGLKNSEGCSTGICNIEDMVGFRGSSQSSTGIRNSEKTATEELANTAWAYAKEGGEQKSGARQLGICNIECVIAEVYANTEWASATAWKRGIATRCGRGTSCS